MRFTCLTLRAAKKNLSTPQGVERHSSPDFTSCKNYITLWGEIQ